MVGLFIRGTPTAYGVGVGEHPVWMQALQGRPVGALAHLSGSVGREEGGLVCIREDVPEKVEVSSREGGWAPG